MSKSYIYCADVYCEDCGRDIKKRLKKEGKRPEDPDDETTYDSSEYPKGPYSESENESDSPQHCGSGEDCLDPLVLGDEKYGKFLENDLTSDGENYVRQAHRDDPTPITELWMEFYNLDPEEEDEDEDGGEGYLERLQGTE